MDLFLHATNVGLFDLDRLTVCGSTLAGRSPPVMHLRGPLRSARADGDSACSPSTSVSLGSAPIPIGEF